MTGAVSYEGKPIANGDILFYPIEGTTGPVSGAAISDGHYEANGKGGVPIGKHRVEIRAYRSAGSSQAATAEDVNRMERQGGQRQQYLPTKFNSESTVRVTVGSDKNPVIQDFQLTD
jgi:hypothetical protein